MRDFKVLLSNRLHGEIDLRRKVAIKNPLFSLMLYITRPKSKPSPLFETNLIYLPALNESPQFVVNFVSLPKCRTLTEAHDVFFLPPRRKHSLKTYIS